MKDVFIHVFYDGKANTFRLSDYPNADLGENSNREDIVSFVEQRLDLSSGTLRSFVVDKTDTNESVNLTVRPSEVFG